MDGGKGCQPLRVWEQMDYTWLDHGIDPGVFAGFAGQMHTNIDLPGLGDYF